MENENKCRLISEGERRLIMHQGWQSFEEVTSRVHIGTVAFVHTRHPNYQSAWVCVIGTNDNGTWRGTLTGNPNITVEFGEKDLCQTMTDPGYLMVFSELDTVYQIPVKELTSGQIQELSDSQYRIFTMKDGNEKSLWYIAPLRYNDWERINKIIEEEK